nr:Chain C, Synthetic peptide GLU-LEU-ARG-ALA-ARG-GLN-GLU-CYS-TYR [synthetic construct]
ELRARQECY